MANVSKQFDAGLIKYTFTDIDGDLIAQWRINPIDPNLAVRFEDGLKKIEEIREREVADNDLRALAQKNNDIEEQVEYILNQKGIFDVLCAMTPDDNGIPFFNLIMETILDTLKPAIEKRAEKQAQQSAAYKKKYTNRTKK